jgi:HSP20 family molecular chaperone IbpA
MNTTTNVSYKSPHMNKTTTTVIIGFLTLVAGLALGAAAAETGSLPKIAQRAQTASSPAAQTAPEATSNVKPSGLGNSNPFQEMRDMQAQIDQSFDKMVEQFRTDPQLSGFKDYPGYSLSLDVRDLKDRYEVQADLPDAKASDVNVSLKNGQTLNVEVSRKSTETSDQKNAATSVIELGQYDQMVRLPTPVKADQMKIQREGHELIITIPKAA